MGLFPHCLLHQRPQEVLMGLTIVIYHRSWPLDLNTLGPQHPGVSGQSPALGALLLLWVKPVTPSTVSLR